MNIISSACARLEEIQNEKKKILRQDEEKKRRFCLFISGSGDCGAIRACVCVTVYSFHSHKLFIFMKDTPKNLKR